MQYYTAMPTPLSLGQIAGDKVLVHVVFGVHAKGHASRGRGSALHLVKIEAHEGLVLFSQLGAERRLVLGAQSHFLLAEHSLADHAHLFESEEGTVVHLLCVVCGAMRRRAIALGAAGRGTRGRRVSQTQLATTLQTLDLVTYLLCHALWGQFHRCNNGFSK